MRRARARLLVGVLLIGALALLATGVLGKVAAVPRASAQAGQGEPVAQTDDSVPAQNVIMLGSSPLEAEGETWGIGEGGSLSSGAWTLVRYSAADGWTRAPEPLDASGQPLSGFEPDRTPLTGGLTTSGAGVLLGTVKTTHELVLVRNPGGTFAEAPLPSAGEAALAPEEELFAKTRTPLIAPLDEGGVAGALLVPVNRSASGVERSVLHWSGASKEWTREPIELPKASEETGGFRVLAIAASSPHNAWILAQLSSGSPSVGLFRREGSTWKEVTPAPLTVDGQPSEPFTVVGAGHEPPTSTSQILTVTEQGLWLDGQRSDAATPVTMFFKPTGETAGEVTGSWCNVPGSFAACSHTLPDSLPAAHLRSFAWPGSGTPFGERVITGLGEGVSLRLEGESFVRVLSLGASEPPNDVGGTLGAAFSSAHEGWLGNPALPVHLTLNPAPSRLINYPVPFRHALAAISAQPGVPVGALSSQALAVGDQGEVARYERGQGWQPESLLTPGGGSSEKRMRAVAWPTPTRAFAVGELGEMWLWRGETGLWEPDPATPLNFKSDLLGIAFDPSNPSRGYAVGQQGALLRYGKTWVQEELPPEAVGASFTSVAFAGSEALVAFRLFHPQAGGEPAHYSGGVLVNSGSGWHLDEGLQQTLHGRIPWAVAGLPDGGAAVSATPDGTDELPVVVERGGPGQAWLGAPPYPGDEAPGSLALFREGGALRAIGSGAMPNTMQVDNERPPPAGFPPHLINPYPLASGYIVRQTAGGWSDEEHERNNARDPLGEYKVFDLPYQPDPTAAVLVDPTGAQGWAVGGAIDSQTPSLDTADVARYPSDGVSPPGVGVAPLQASSTAGAFAIAGGAECLAPCADRANARLGPDVWLSSAIDQASQIAGVRDFLYTGPRVTTGVGHGSVSVPYSREFARYAAVLAGPLQAWTVASPGDRGPGNECEFQQVFSGYPWAEPGAEGCPSFYAFDSPGPGGTVRVVMLDESGEVEGKQLEWLAKELEHAGGRGIPAIVVGNADLNAEIAGGQGAAAAVAQTLVDGNASAYFYDSPEQNIKLPLRVGSRSIPTFGSGTIGYVSSTSARKTDFIGQMGFLLAQVEFGKPNPENPNITKVTAELVPNIGELAMEAKEGLLLNRSQAALFAGLARRPRAGGRASRGSAINESTLYVPIPANCVGSDCSSGIEPEFTFSSSRPDIGNFVKPNLAVPDPHAVLLEHEEPIPDSKSGLFCAFNAGKTVVTISSGGLSASLTVTVQAGSVRRPCGTTPLKELPAQEQVAVPPPVPAPAPAPAGPSPASSPPSPVPVPPLPAPPAAAAPAHPAPKPPAPFFVQAAVAAPLLPFVPLPVPTPARPTPPSGTSAVTSPVEAAEKEEEREEAPESVSNKAVAYRSHEHEPSPVYLLGLVVLAAFAGASVRRRPRGGRRAVRVAPATISTIRSQRRFGRDKRKPL